MNPSDALAKLQVLIKPILTQLTSEFEKKSEDSIMMIRTELDRFLTRLESSHSAIQAAITNDTSRIDLLILRIDQLEKKIENIESSLLLDTLHNTSDNIV